MATRHPMAGEFTTNPRPHEHVANWWEHNCPTRAGQVNGRQLGLPCDLCSETGGVFSFTDAQLRSECERRGMAIGVKALQDFAVAEQAELVRTKADRDEWKRRAEAAEAAIRDIPHIPAGWTVGGYIKKLQCESEGRGKAIDRLTSDRDSLSTVLQRERIERGPGIATMPARDNSVAWLDEDLLCEDA